MAADYKKLYKVSAREYNYDTLRQLIKNNYRKNTSFNSDDYYRIINSYKWRLVSKIRTPEVIRKVIRKVVR